MLLLRYCYPLYRYSMIYDLCNVLPYYHIYLPLHSCNSHKNCSHLAGYPAKMTPFSCVMFYSSRFFPSQVSHSSLLIHFVKKANVTFGLNSGTMWPLPLMVK